MLEVILEDKPIEEILPYITKSDVFGMRHFFNINRRDFMQSLSSQHHFSYFEQWYKEDNSNFHIAEDMREALGRVYGKEFLTYAREFGLLQLGFIGRKKREGIHLKNLLYRVDGVALRYYCANIWKRQEDIIEALQDLEDDMKVVVYEHGILSNRRYTKSDFGPCTSAFLDALEIKGGIITKILAKQRDQPLDEGNFLLLKQGTY